MQEVTIYDAKTRLMDEQQPRVWGQYAGQIVIADDFDAPLPPDIQRYFE